MGIPKPYPVLAYGSVGQAVLLLQRALNLGPTQQLKLKEDSQFGPKTRNRVVEFQGQKNISKDGVVGPVTWSQLEPFIQQILKIIDQNFPVSTDDTVQRQRIIDIAKASFETWGWGEGGVVSADGSVRIAAARGFGPSMAGRRARQGGIALATIYSMATAGGANCLTISTSMEAVYQQDAKKHPERTDKINQEDIGSWCGIFATYCYRSTGLKVTWDDVKHQRPKYFESLKANDAVRKGDIGVYDPARNHHFVVMEDTEPGRDVNSIDGNVANPVAGVVAPWNSVIAKRTYQRSTLAGKGGKFLRPIFAAMV
ncbi:MAG: peptidoglycan-binding protein [Acidobacteria bacterium]|nr:peptidoglycan-binding protein [Acidobacteriota bacterium]